MLEALLLVAYYADPPFFTRKFVNQAYCSFFGVKAEQAIGRSCLETSLEENREQVRKKLEYCIKNNAVLVSVEPVIKSDGTISLVRWVDVPAKDKTGKIIELISIGSLSQDRRKREDRRQSRLDFGL
jgi:PAS domain S-box-containing protein